jgi:hypothetical protein
VELSVIKATPVIEWPTPAPIAYGNPLGAGQLNAASPVAGTFAYTPGQGELLDAGTYKIEVAFTPTNDRDYYPAYASVLLSVAKATPTIEWPAPDPIPCGTLLGTQQLCATSAIAGTLVYSPANGESLNAGDQTLTAHFTPADTRNYNETQASIVISVLKASPAIEWPTPAPIPYGTALGSAQLNATAAVPGTFTYTPCAGTVLTSGSQTLLVTFTPTDSVNYSTTEISVPLNVEALPSMGSLTQGRMDAEFGDPFRALQASGMRMRGRDQSMGSEIPLRTPETPAASQPFLIQKEAFGSADSTDTARETVQVGSTTNKQSEPETRTYKGATYVKGSDGQWHLKQE